MFGRIYRNAIGAWLALLVVVLAAAESRGETKEETFASGKPKVRYNQVDGQKEGLYEEFFESGGPRITAAYRDGLLQGEYLRYYEDGKLKVRANYRKGKKHGAYIERDAEGRLTLSMNYSAGKPRGKHTIHRDGRRHWEYVWKKGELLKVNGTNTHLHSIKDLKKGLGKILKAKVKLKSAPEEHVAALRRLNSYRFLCGLPADITLDAKQSYHCQAAAELLTHAGELNHTPPQPSGMSEAKYKDAFLGTTRSNLAVGDNLEVSVDHYMYDSDTFNIRTVGHRRWCMNPQMKTTGFGQHTKFCTMWSMDNRRKKPPEPPYIAFPPQGYLPVEFFSTHHAWCVALNNKHVRSSENSRAAIFPLDENLVPGEPLKLAHHSFVGEAGPGADWGPENVLVFKPESLDLTPGSRYAVEITGLTGKNDKEFKLHYVVQFIELNPESNEKSSSP